MNTKVIEQINEFEELKDKWDNLLEESNYPNIFLTWEWLFEWYKWFGGQSKLYIITVWDNKDLIAIAPFVKERIKLLNITLIKFLGTTYVCSDYLNIITKKGFETQAIEEIFSFIAADKSWDIVELRDMDQDAINVELFLRESIHKKFTVNTEITVKCPYIVLPSSMAEFYSRLGHDPRYKIRRNKRNMIELFQYQIKHINNIKKLFEALELMFELNKQCYLVKQ